MALVTKSRVPFPLSSRPLHFSSSTSSTSSLYEDSGYDTDSFSDDKEFIDTVVSVLQQQRSRSRWGYLKSLLRPHTALTPSQISQIILRLRNRPRLALSFFQWSKRSTNSNHDLHSHSILIHVLARSRLRHHALSTIQSAILVSDDVGGRDVQTVPEIFKILVETYRECDSAPFVFDLVIRACLVAKRIDRAVAIVRFLRSRGIFFLEDRTLSEVIRVMSKMRGSEAGFEIYKECLGSEEGLCRGSGSGFRPKTRVFNAMLVSCYRDGKLGTNAAEICEDMKRFGCAPNCFTYSILMAGFCDEGKVEEGAARVWEEMRDKKMKPDVVAYNTIIGGFCKIGNVMRAEELFREMVIGEGGGMEPTGSTYEHLIIGHCKAGDVNAAILVYNDMRRMGFGLGVMTVEKLVDELCDKERVDQGFLVFRNEMRKDVFHPGRQCYKRLIKGLCADGRMENAARLQSEMVGKGFEADLEVYGVFVAGYMKQGEGDKAQMLKEEMSKFGARS